MQNTLVPITGEDEQRRQRAQDQNAAGSPEVQIAVERAMILSMEKDANTATIKTQRGNIYQVRVKTPKNLIFLIWGNPEELNNIPCTLHYKGFPANGYIELGGPDPYQVSKKDKSISRPFSL